MNNKIMELADRYRDLKVGEGTAQARAALQAEVVNQQVGYIQMLNTLRSECSGHINQIIRLQAELAGAEAVNNAAALEIVSLQAEIEEAKVDATIIAYHEATIARLTTELAAAKAAPQPKAEPVNQMLLDALKEAADCIRGDWGNTLEVIDAALAKAEQAPQPAEFSDAEINLIACEHLEPEADDMHQLVRFARAVLAAQGAKTK